MRKSPFIVPFVLSLVLFTVACRRQLPADLTPVPLPTLRPPLELLWSSPVVAPDNWIGTALIDGGMLYYSTSSSRFTTGRQYAGAFDLQSRRSRWVIPTTVDLPVMVEKGHVLLVDETTATLTALRSLDGSRVWHVSLPAFRHYGATTGSGLAFVGSGDEVVAIDAATGHLAWRYSLPQGFQVDTFFKIDHIKFRREYSPLAHDKGVLYVRAVSEEIEGGKPLDCLLLALNVQDGEELWAFPFVIEMPLGDAPFVATQPALSDTGLLLLTWGGTGYFLDKATGRVIWKKADLVSPMRVNPRIWSRQAIIEQVRNLTSLDTQNGQVQWSREIVLIVALWISDGTVFLVHHIEPTLLTAIDLQTGDVIAERSLSPLESEGKLPVFALAGDSHTLYLVLGRNVYAFSMP